MKFIFCMVIALVDGHHKYESAEDPIKNVRVIAL
jgi:hypothetical protein